MELPFKFDQQVKQCHQGSHHRQVYESRPSFLRIQLETEEELPDTHAD